MEYRGGVYLQIPCRNRASRCGGIETVGGAMRDFAGKLL